MTVTDRVRTFIVDDLGWDGSPTDLTDDLALIDAGVLDSMGIFELVTLLEEEYGIEVADEDVLPTNFGSLDAISRYVHARR